MPRGSQNRAALFIHQTAGALGRAAVTAGLAAFGSFHAARRGFVARAACLVLGTAGLCVNAASRLVRGYAAGLLLLTTGESLGTAIILYRCLCLGLGRPKSASNH